MRDVHFQCHFCPVGNNHRFYKDLDDLLKHLSSTHFLCSLCLNSQLSSSSGVTDASIVAFKRQGEYAEVLEAFHCFCYVTAVSCTWLSRVLCGVF